MPKYRVSLSDGRTFEVEASAPPSEADIMAQLGGSTAAPKPSGPSKPARTWTDTAVDALPAIGGALGGIAGGIGGTVFGLGVGGVPGALGGATAGGATGEAARQLVNRARGAAAPTSALDAAKGIGIEGGIQGASQAVGGLIGKGVGYAAGRLAPAAMQSALKPGIRSTLGAIKKGQIPPVVRTLLDEGINVTPGGIEKLNGIIGASNVAIKDALASLPSNPTISPLAVAGRLSPMARQAAVQVNNKADLKAISKAGHEFLDGAKNMSVQEAQAMKTGTYRALSEKAYGEVKSTAIEAQKALARGLKEEIEREAKAAGIDIGAMNAREGAAITAKEAIAKRVAQVGNRDPAGLAWLAHSPVTFMMALAERSPVVKSYLARGLWQAAAKSSGMPVDVLKFAIGAIASKSQQEPE